MSKKISDLTVSQIIAIFKGNDFMINKGYLYINGNAYPLDQEVEIKEVV